MEKRVALWDEMSGRYDSMFLKRRHLKENGVAVRAVCDLGVRAFDRVLDVGCGTGLLLDEAAWLRPGVNYLGVDISAGMIEMARLKHPLANWQVADMERIPGVEDNTFDAIVSLFGSFCYVQDPEEAVSGFWRMLKPGGWLQLQVYGPLFAYRRRHIIGHVPFMIWNTARGRDLFRAFEDVRVRGFSSVLTTRLGFPFVGLEASTLGRVWPDMCEYLIIEGRRPDVSLS